jgi:hypothetical protein
MAGPGETFVRPYRYPFPPGPARLVVESTWEGAFGQRLADSLLDGDAVHCRFGSVAHSKSEALQSGAVERRMERGGHGLPLKFHLGPPCPTLLCPAGGPTPKRPYGRFGEWPACRAGGLWPSYYPLGYPPCRTSLLTVASDVSLHI